VAWDTRPESEGGQRWFHLQPDEAVPPGDLLHWTGPAGSWNTMCADCHSTNFRKNYDEATASYTSTWSEIDVACEACHGPGSAHVAWAEAGADPEVSGRGLGITLAADHAWRFEPGSPIARRVPAGKPTNEIEVCAACHARRSQIAEGLPTDAFLDRYHPALLEEGLYHADGQILDEVYVWGSFLQSKMYAAGVGCSDCHDPHRLQIEEPDAACGRCHQSETFASASHHHHEEGSPGASCVGCHMPTRNYMVVDARHDHSFRVPRPDLSRSIGVPNSCTGCHADRSNAWAAEQTASWPGVLEAGAAASKHYGEVLAAGRSRAPGASAALARLAEDTNQPAIVRATAIRLLGAQLSREALPAILSALTDPDPLLRMAAVGSTEAFPPEDRWTAVEGLLTDPLRAVRIEAARVLASMRPRLPDAQSRARLDRALADYKQTQAINADWPAAHVNLGILYAELGDLGAAAREYEKALRLGPSFLPAYINLADLERQRGREAASEAVLLEALQRFPDNADIHHTLGLLFVRSQRTPEAVEMLSRAAALAPGNPRYAYVYGVALHSTGESARALDVLAEAHRAHPGSTEILIALATLHRDLGQVEQALVYARKLLALSPNSPDAQGLVRALESASG
jgi:tetratricopeptide (TPR) repeat protein